MYSNHSFVLFVFHPIIFNPNLFFVLFQAKGLRDGMVSSNENVRTQLLGEVEGVSKQGPQTVVLQKSQQGFGFTLRHFILYPPSLQTHIKVTMLSTNGLF